MKLRCDPNLDPALRDYLRNLLGQGIDFLVFCNYQSFAKEKTPRVAFLTLHDGEEGEGLFDISDLMRKIFGERGLIACELPTAEELEADTQALLRAQAAV